MPSHEAGGGCNNDQRDLQLERAIDGHAELVVVVVRRRMKNKEKGSTRERWRDVRKEERMKEEG